MKEPRHIEEVLEDILEELQTTNRQYADLLAVLQSEKADTLLNATQAAEIAGVSRRTIYSWVERGLLKQQVINNRIGFFRADCLKLKRI